MPLLARFLGKSSPDSPHGAQASEASQLAVLAAELLTTPTALMQLTNEEARVVVGYMQQRRIAEGTTFIQEGDTRNTGFMLLVLGGEVTVETIVVSRVEPVTVTVLGVGSLIGEMGMLDGEPRSASCTASSELICAILTRDALEALMTKNPRVAAKLMLAVSLRITQRLRDASDKLKMYAQLTLTMQQEIDHMVQG
jgi:CRP/FNR family transcriptional regulator, cyclic AMP receptor protein